MSIILAVIALLNNLWEAWKLFRAAQNAAATAEDDKKRLEREKAADGLKQAQTEEEFDRASDSLHNNSH